MQLKVREVARKRGWFKVVQSGLGIAVVASEDDIPADLVTLITQPVLKWRRKRGVKAHMLSLTFSAAPEMHQAIEAALHQLYKRTAALQFVFDRLSSISVTLCDEQGSALRSYSLDLLGLLQGKYMRKSTPIESHSPPEEPKPDKKVAKTKY
jgi:hypothetical protein